MAKMRSLVLSSGECGFQGPIEAIEYAKQGKQIVPIVYTFQNEMEFKEKLLGNITTVFELNKKKQPVRAILSWEDAVATFRSGSVIGVKSLAGVFDDVSNLKAAMRNQAMGLECQTNFAIASDRVLLDKYSPMHVLNDGRGLIFDDVSTGLTVVQVDGLIANTHVVLVNECKSSLDPRHIHGVPQVEGDAEERSASEMSMIERAGLLEFIFKHPERFKSKPVDVMAACAGKTVKPVASGYMVDPTVAEECQKLGIELIAPRGPGGAYAVTQ